MKDFVENVVGTTSATAAATPKRWIMGAKNLLLPGWMSLTFPLEPPKEANTPAWVVQLLKLQKDPETLFHTLLVTLVSVTVMVRLYQYQLNHNHNKSSSQQETIEDPTTSKFQQWKFLAVFFCLRTSFWMSGPYFYAAYASKTLPDGSPMTAEYISYISLVGYASIALFGPYLGKLLDQYGRKGGTIAACVFYGMGCLSATASRLYVLYGGRLLGGLGTSLLSAAPEAWLVSTLQGQSGTLKQTFTTAYAYDPVVAIAAGQLAGFCAKQLGPTGPFQVSPLFLLTGGILAAVFWEENRASSASSTGSASKEDDNTINDDKDQEPASSSSAVRRPSSSSAASATDDDEDSTEDVSETSSVVSDSNNNNSSSSTIHSSKIGSNNMPIIKKKKPTPPPTIADAVRMVRNDSTICFLGSVQALFEGAMYIFVLQWPPMFNKAVQLAYGKHAITPYGTAFSCFMASCMAGSTLFGILGNRTKKGGPSANKNFPLERQTIFMLGVATLSLFVATLAAATDATSNQLPILILAFFTFEACVGMYFPSIGTLRSTYLPDTHRGVLMTLYGVPQNIIVVTVFLLVPKLGTQGAMLVASICVGMATACMAGLYVTLQRKKRALRKRFQKAIRRVVRMKSMSGRLQHALKRNLTEGGVREVLREHRRNHSSMGGPLF